jgi:small subunit ribosomal protein S16
VGSKKNPIWRVVVADQRSPRDGRFIETIGHYNPQTEPSTIVIDDERMQHWLARGAQPTGTVKQLMKAKSRGAEAEDAPVQAASPAAEPDAAAGSAEPPEADAGAAESAERAEGAPADAPPAAAAPAE